MASRWGPTMTRQIKPPQGDVGDALQSLSSAPGCFEATRSPSAIIYRCSPPLALTPSGSRTAALDCPESLTMPSRRPWSGAGFDGPSGQYLCRGLCLHRAAKFPHATVWSITTNHLIAPSRPISDPNYGNRLFRWQVATSSLSWALRAKILHAHPVQGLRRGTGPGRRPFDLTPSFLTSSLIALPPNSNACFRQRVRWDRSLPRRKWDR